MGETGSAGLGVGDGLLAHPLARRQPLTESSRETDLGAGNRGAECGGALLAQAVHKKRQYQVPELLVLGGDAEVDHQG